ncbi:MAG: hypothetical protein DI535_15825 [Citrobacter freundii]|nr:MAG: hypothetical protein DI535_15825 [Citrobacter freundii]
MKRFKAIDLRIQIFLVPLFTIIAIIDQGYFFTAYIVVGSWQMLSALLHLWLGQHNIALKARRSYTIAAFSSLILMLLFFTLGTTTFIYYGAFMLIVSPMLAIWYIYICYEENKRLEHKKLIHLK